MHYAGNAGILYLTDRRHGGPGEVPQEGVGNGGFSNCSIDESWYGKGNIWWSRSHFRRFFFWFWRPGFGDALRLPPRGKHPRVARKSSKRTSRMIVGLSPTSGMRRSLEQANRTPLQKERLLESSRNIFHRAGLSP
jgi:hypothetical protein